MTDRLIGHSFMWHHHVLKLIMGDHHQDLIFFNNFIFSLHIKNKQFRDIHEHVNFCWCYHNNNVTFRLCCTANRQTKYKQWALLVTWRACRVQLMLLGRAWFSIRFLSCNPSRVLSNTSQPASRNSAGEKRDYV